MLCGEPIRPRGWMRHRVQVRLITDRFDQLRCRGGGDLLVRVDADHVIHVQATPHLQGELLEIAGEHTSPSSELVVGLVTTQNLSGIPTIFMS